MENSKTNFHRQPEKHELAFFRKGRKLMKVLTNIYFIFCCVIFFGGVGISLYLIMADNRKMGLAALIMITVGLGPFFVSSLLKILANRNKSGHGRQDSKPIEILTGVYDRNYHKRIRFPTIGSYKAYLPGEITSSLENRSKVRAEGIHWGDYFYVFKVEVLNGEDQGDVLTLNRA